MARTKWIQTFVFVATTYFAVCIAWTSPALGQKHILTKRASSQSVADGEMKKGTIAIVGSGAVGCYYGARLWETKEYHVKFLMRGDHLTVSKEKGVNVTSVAGDIFIPPEELLVYDSVGSMGKVDWVILSLKSTSIEATASLIRPLLHENSRVIAIMNGLVDDDILRYLEGQSQDDEPLLTRCAAVYGGMAFLCSNRKSPGHVDHSYAGKLTASLSRSSNLFTDMNVHKEAIISLWKSTRGFEFSYDENLVRARWLKNLWNLPFNGISVAMNGITVDMIVGDPGLRKLALKVMDETAQIANSDLAYRGYSEDDYLGVEEKKAMMDLSDNMGPYKTSTMLDLVNRNPMEVKYLFRKAVDRAAELNVSTPILDTLVTQIEFLQRIHNLY